MMSVAHYLACSLLSLLYPQRGEVEGPLWISVIIFPFFSKLSVSPLQTHKSSPSKHLSPRPKTHTHTSPLSKHSNLPPNTHISPQTHKSPPSKWSCVRIIKGSTVEAELIYLYCTSYRRLLVLCSWSTGSVHSVTGVSTLW